MVCFAIIVFAAPGAMQITLIEDITALLPKNDQGQTSLSELARDSGLMTKVLVVVGPVKKERAKLHEFVDGISETLGQIDGVREVVSGADATKGRKTAEVILQHAPRLYRPLLAEGDFGDIETRLGHLKNRLASPEAMVIGSYLLADPLGVTRQTLAGLEALAGASGTTTEEGHFLSADKTTALIILSIDFDPFEVSKAQRFISTLEETVQAARSKSPIPECKVTALGGVTYVARNASSAQKDIFRAFVATTVLVLLIFLLLFRRLRLLPAALLPGGIGIVVALSVFGFTGYPLHPLTLGFAATITGISVDYAIHLMYRARTESAKRSEDKIRAALEHTSRPIILGCLTTLGAFLIVGTSNFTGIRQLALFSAISIPIAMVVTLFCLPAFHGFLAGTRNDGPSGILAKIPLEPFFLKMSGAAERASIICLFAVLFGACLFAARGVELSGDPKNLGSKDEDLEARELAVKSAFPGLLKHVYLVASERTLESALKENDRLYEKLIEKGVPRQNIVSLSPFLPSQNTQQKSIEVLSEYLFSGETKHEVKNAFLKTGFKEEYYSSLKDTFNASPVTPQTYGNTSLESLVKESIKLDGEQTRIFTRVRAENDKDIFALKLIANENTAWTIASERLETMLVLELFQKELARMLATWIFATLLVLSLLERSFSYGVKTILPALFGVLSSVGLFAILGRPLTPVASAGLTLVLGLGIDYGLFMQSKTRDLGRTGTAIIASALTTMAAFGVLVFADTRAMSDMGTIILVGVLGSLLTAVVLLPALNSHRISK